MNAATETQQSRTQSYREWLGDYLWACRHDLGDAERGLIRSLVAFLLLGFWGLLLEHDVDE